VGSLESPMASARGSDATFNSTREDSYAVSGLKLGVKIAGDQKTDSLSSLDLVNANTWVCVIPFLTEPVSDWFIGGLIAQVRRGPWQSTGSVQREEHCTMAIDFLLQNLGGLINIYSHTLSTGFG